MSPILSIITVVRDDIHGLMMTADSVEKMRNLDEVEYFVWLNSNSENMNNFTTYLEAKSIRYVIGDDSGIFDAMNKAIGCVSGDYVLMLNARDVIEQNFCVSQISGPTLIRVGFQNYFGREKMVPVKKTIKNGLPYCHQGMILPRRDHIYPVNRKFGGDYAAFLDLKTSWPLPVLGSGLIRYDNSGVSSRNRLKSDLSTVALIFERFGLFYAFSFAIKSFAKISIKRAYDIIRIIGRNFRF